MITGMMLLALTHQARNTNFDYSGLPTLSSASIAVQGANVTFKLDGQTATTTELILLKNTTHAAVDATLTIPRFRAGGVGNSFPTFPIGATWSKTQMTLAGGSQSKAADGTFASPLTSAVHFAADETVALRIQFGTTFGTSGYGGNQSVVGFKMSQGQAIPQVNLSFGYNQHTVFDLPKMAPSWKWQVGRTGAAIRLANFAPGGQLVTATFYSGGFESIH